MPRYLEITDGTTSFRLDGSDATDYFAVKAKQWSPAISRRSGDSFGGELYLPVTEAMPLMVQSTDATAVMANIETLNGLIEQAGRWYLNEDVAPVVIRFSALSSTDYLQAVITGPPDNGQAISLPGNFEEYLAMGRVTGLSLSFKRKGQWLDEEESDTGSGAVNPGVMTASFEELSGALELPSPTTIALGSFTSAPWGGSFLCLTDEEDKLDVFSVASLTSTGFAQANDAAANPKNGTYVLRFTPPDTTWHQTGVIDLAEEGLKTSTKEVAVFVSAKKSNASLNALVKARISPQSGGYNTLAAAETPPVAITLENRQWYYLGIIRLPIEMGQSSGFNFSLFVKCDSTSYTIDLDACALMDVEGDENYVIYFPSSDAYGLWSYLNINQRSLSKPDPEVWIGITSLPYLHLPYRGSPRINTSSVQIAGLWLATSKSFSPVKECWNAVRSNGTALTNALTVTRSPGYLIPQ